MKYAQAWEELKDWLFGPNGFGDPAVWGVLGATEVLEKMEQLERKYE